MNNRDGKGRFATHLTNDAVGVLMKDVVERIIRIAQKHRHSFVVSEKESSDDRADFFTNADKEAQDLGVKWLQERFPDWGIVGEEDNLRIPCTLPGRNLFLTLDPIDGTRAYMRRQSDSIGTMLALVEDGRVVAACIGDIMTRELYYFRPGSGLVHRLSWPGDPVTLKYEQQSLRDQVISFREEWQAYPSVLTNRLCGIKHGGIFKKVTMHSGSIGIHFARLWKGELGAILLAPGKEYPWDRAPVIGLNEQLGFVHVPLWGNIKEKLRAYAEDPPAYPDVTDQVEVLEHPTLFLHRTALPELAAAW